MIIRLAFFFFKPYFYQIIILSYEIQNSGIDIVSWF